jgi:hypothetical protein
LLQVTKDAVHGSEAGKAISFYVLDALISIDHEKYFLNQLQSRGILRSCLSDVTNYLSKVCTATAIFFSFLFFIFQPADPKCRLHAIMHSHHFDIADFLEKWISLCGLLFLLCMLGWVMSK